MNAIDRLQQWYAKQCNGDWEHFQGITIESCDNPGWWVKINLTGTALENTSFVPIADAVDAAGFQTGDRWLCCRIVDGSWNGSGDETKLEHILEVFLEWAEGHGS
jgi:hypothetical protein